MNLGTETQTKDGGERPGVYPERGLVPGRVPTIVSLVDELLMSAVDFGSLRGILLSQHALGILTREKLLSEIRLPQAKSILRMMCARLAKVIQERSGQEFEPYGNDAEFETELTPGKPV